MKRFRIPRQSFNGITTEGSYEAVPIEIELQRVINNEGEGVKAITPMIYTERKDGVLPAYNIRTDRFDIAVDAMDKAAKSREAKRMDRIEKREAEAEAKKAKAAKLEELINVEVSE